MEKTKTIGIVGGIGPYAGLELCRNIMDQTNAVKDQEHLSIAMLSFPSEISDRTAFILGETDVNPAYAIVEVIKKLVSVGSKVIGINCNTSHAPQIYNVITEELKRQGIEIKLVNMVEEVAKYICTSCQDVKKVGILSTTGCYMSRVYENTLLKVGLEPIVPNLEIQDNVVQKAIYDTNFGIKALSSPVSREAKQLLNKAILYFKERNADAIILGCTELSLAITGESIDKVKVIDSTKILAKALIRESIQDTC